MRSFLHDCWPLVAAFALATLCTICCGADQKPLVINPTTGKQEQMQSGNNLLIPGTSTLTVSSLTSGRIPFSTTGGLQTDSASLTYSGTSLVNTGLTGLGGATNSQTILSVGASNPLSGATQVGILVTPTGTTNGTTALRGVQASLITAASSYTVSDVVAIFGGSTTQGAGSTITRATSVWAADPNSGNNKACLVLGGFSLSYTGNFALLSTSTDASRWSGPLQARNTTSATSTTTGSVIVGDGSTAASNVGIGGGNIVAGGNITLASAGSGLSVKEGTNAKMGAATLVGGTVTVNTTAVTASSRIYLTSQVDGGTPGFQRVSARSAGTSFTITSSNVLDTSTVAWMIVEPAP